jgi:hypothetical protein
MLMWQAFIGQVVIRAGSVPLAYLSKATVSAFLRAAGVDHIYYVEEDKWNALK